MKNRPQEIRSRSTDSYSPFNVTPVECGVKDLWQDPAPSSLSSVSSPIKLVTTEALVQTPPCHGSS